MAAGAAAAVVRFASSDSAVSAATADGAYLTTLERPLAYNLGIGAWAAVLGSSIGGDGTSRVGGSGGGGTYHEVGGGKVLGVAVDVVASRGEG